MQSRRVTRRDFLMSGTLTLASASVIRPSRIYASSMNKLNTAHVGVGGKGQGHLNRCAERENVVALCDVDDTMAAKSYEKYPNVARYKDYRVMLEKQKDIDAVVIATPDHTHAIIAMAAMELGKHVYVEKPLTHSIFETRALTNAAAKIGVVTQMGNQGHSMDGVRDTCEMLWDGAIGTVREAHCFTNRPIWPQGIKDPLPAQPVPDTMAWDLWLGPAPERPYNEGYAPDNWRGWWDFGCGALGDMGCHIMDPAFWALHLGAPSSVEPVMEEGLTLQCAPLKSVVKYEFPERTHEGETLPPVLVYWHDGSEIPPKPEEIPEEDWPKPGASGTVFVGSDGYLVCDSFGEGSQLLPKEKMADYKKPDPILERVPQTEPDKNNAHRDNWIDACKGGKPSTSPFSYSGPLTEMVHLGNVALRAGKRIEWDSEKMEITNDPDANRFIRRKYREGWEL